jgi:uncharacterized protein YjbI with pentapeptide repeats
MSERKTHQSLQASSRRNKMLGLVKSTSEFFSDTVDMVKGSNLAEAFGKAASWSKDIVEAGEEASALIKFAVKLIEKLKHEDDPEIIGLLALQIAYQEAVRQAINQHDRAKAVDHSDEAIKQARDFIKSIEPRDDIDVSTFSMKNPLDHEFISQADLFLKAAIRPFKYTEEEINRILDKVHDRFRDTLRLLFSSPETEKKFKTFEHYSTLGAQEKQAFKALKAHTEYQRWLYESSPVLGKAPFALEHIYVDPECGRLSWAEIDRVTNARDSFERERFDPFSEQCGGRHSLLETVMSLIGDSQFKDAIIIQGIAGAGKSSFTVRLCAELLNNGLRPLRVRLKDLRFDRHISEAIPEALALTDEIHSQTFTSPTKPDNLFSDGNIFKESTTFRGIEICRYVLILDGWDEITLGSGEGFQKRVANMLEQIRSEYLQGKRDRTAPVRVILTGRPSPDVTKKSEDSFLRDQTRLLTIRPLQPQVLESFVEKVIAAVSRKYLRGEQIEEWLVPDAQRFASILKRYQDEFSRHLQESGANRGDSRFEDSSVGIIGLPLLAFLTVRLIAEWKGNAEDLVNDPSTLYRSLIDLTCEKAGKAQYDADDIEGQPRFAGEDLRKLLHQTAAAMTAYGKDAIPYDELEERLQDSQWSLQERVSEVSPLSSLVISFYFKGGNPNLGCEFAHKSFREYLFAEAIVEALKDYGRSQRRELAERADYWKEFEAHDPRFELSRMLSKLLAPQWLTVEVQRHLESLIKWEITRTKIGHETEGVESTLASLDLQGWKQVRDSLADLWDWWGEGVHLRPQIRREKGDIKFDPPFVQELIEHSAPYHKPKGSTLPIPVRSTTMDAHLGDGLFLLCVLVHHFIKFQEGWKGFTHNSQNDESMNAQANTTGDTEKKRRYQRVIEANGLELVFFSPSGQNPIYFQTYTHRINSAGWRPRNDFPMDSILYGVDLGEVFLIGARLNGTNLVDAYLNGAILNGAFLGGASLGGASLGGAFLVGADLDGADLVGAFLDGAFLYDASLNGANLSDTYLYGASFNRAYLNGANLVDAYLNGASFNHTMLDYENYEYLRQCGVDVSKALIIEGEASASEFSEAINSENDDIEIELDE